jgi:hypothetical protein
VFLIVGRDALPSAMALVGCAGWTAQGVLLFAVARGPFGAPVAAWLAAAVALGAARSHLFVPLETNLVAACGLGALLLAVRARSATCGALLGLAVVLRPDAVLLALPAGALLVRSRASVPSLMRATLAAVIPGVAWLLFATAYYGSPIARTLGAKAFHDPLLVYATHLGRLLPSIALPFEPPIFVAIVAWLAVAWGARVGIARRADVITALLAWGALHAGAYLALRPGTGFTWHLYPSALAFVVAMLVALGDALTRLRPWLWAPLGAAAVVCASLGTVKFARTHRHVFWYGSRDAVYRKAATWLQSAARPGDVTEAEEVGTMAYWSDLTFYDHAGLVGAAFDHGRLARGTAPEVRFSVMTQPAEVEAHLPFFGRVPPMKELSYDRWHLWIADLRAPPSP